MYKIDQSKIPQMSTSDPLLGAIGSVVGSAIGTAVGGPAGGAIGGSIGGQLGGTGTIDLEKTAIDSTKGAAGSMLTGGLNSVIANQQGALAAANDLGISPLSQQAQMLGEQGGVEFAPGVFDEDPKAGFFGALTQRYFSTGGNVGHQIANSIGDSIGNFLSPEQAYESGQAIRRGQGVNPDAFGGYMDAYNFGKDKDTVGQIAQAIIPFGLGFLPNVIGAAGTEMELNDQGSVDNALSAPVPEGYVAFSDPKGNVMHATNAEANMYQNMVAGNTANAPMPGLGRIVSYGYTDLGKAQDGTIVGKNRDGVNMRFEMGPNGQLRGVNYNMPKGPVSFFSSAPLAQQSQSSSSSAPRGTAGTSNNYGGNYTSATERGLSIARADQANSDGGDYGD